MLTGIGTTIVLVRVGSEPNHTDLAVHQDLLLASSSSSFFQRAIDQSTNTAQQPRINLSTSASKDFQVYIQWLYTSRLCVTTSKLHTLWPNLINAYLLGTCLQDVVYRDTIADVILAEIETASQAPIAAFIKHHACDIIDKTNKKGLLYQLLVDVTVWLLDHDPWVSVERHLPASFVRVAAAGLSARFRSHDLHVSPFHSEETTCRYHCHGSRSCYREPAPE